MAKEKKEDPWTERICAILNDHFKESKPAFHAEVKKNLPYGTVIEGFDGNWKPVYAQKEITFETDLLIYEKKGGKAIPRVVIEAKYKDAGTHDAITYGKKSTMHRTLMPYLRYGMMIGANGNGTLTWKHFEHGSDFDFMFAFKGEEPDDIERKKFVSLVDSEIKNSQGLWKIFVLKEKGEDIYCVQKDLKLLKK